MIARFINYFCVGICFDTISTPNQTLLPKTLFTRLGKRGPSVSYTRGICKFGAITAHSYSAQNQQPKQRDDGRENGPTNSIFHQCKGVRFSSNELCILFSFFPLRLFNLIKSDLLFSCCHCCHDRAAVLIRLSLCFGETITQLTGAAQHTKAIISKFDAANKKTTRKWQMKKKS